MKINSNLANGIKIVGGNYEYIKAVKKPNADTKITMEVWCKWKKNKQHKK